MNLKKKSLGSLPPLNRDSNKQDITLQERVMVSCRMSMTERYLEKFGSIMPMFFIFVKGLIFKYKARVRPVF